MKRRDFIKQMGSAPLAARELATAMFAAGETAFAADTPAPRVQGERQTLDLSGAWQFRMDSANRGLDGKWFQSEPTRAEAQAITVKVPSVWQQYVDEVGGIAWYSKVFVLPKELSGRGLRLRFGAVDYRAQVWLNGQELGVHEGGFTPFEWDVRNAAHVGENRL